MMRHDTLERLFAAFRGWCVAWGLSRLARDATIQFDDTLGAALGLCHLPAGRIVLNGVLLLPENEELLFETLCHEAAHLVVYLRYGPGIAEHGPEWQEAMARAGFRPRAVIPVGWVHGLGGQGPGPVPGMGAAPGRSRRRMGSDRERL